MTKRVSTHGKSRQNNSGRQRTGADVQKSARRLEILYEIDRSLLSGRPPEITAKEALARIRQLVPCPRASVTLFDFSKSEATFLAEDYDIPNPSPEIVTPLQEYGEYVLDELRLNRALIVDDVLAHPGATDLDKSLAGKGLRAWLYLPLFFEGQLFGALNLSRKIGNPFTGEDADIASSVAEQLAVVLQQARLREALQREIGAQQALIANLETLRKSAAIVASTLNQVETAEQVLEQIARVVPYDSASIHLLEGDTLQIIAGRGFPADASIIGARLPLLDDELTKPIIYGTAAYILYDDIQLLPAGFRIPPQQTIHSWLAVPLKLKGGLIGFITLDGRQVGQFTQQHAELMLIFADQVSVALENARLFTSLQQELTERRLADSRVHRLEELYRRAIEAANAVPYYLNYKEGKYDFMGSGILEMTGYSAGEITQDIYDSLVQECFFLGETEQSPYNESVLRARGGDIPVWRSDNRIRRRDGRERWLSDSAVQVKDERGEITGSIGILQDITWRKQAEQKIAHVARQLAMLNEIGRAVAEIADLNTVLEVIRQQLQKVVEFDCYSVRIFNESERTVTYLAVYESGRYWDEPVTPLTPGTDAYQVFETGKSILHLLTAEEIELDRQTSYTHVGDQVEMTTSLIFVPLKKQGQTLGALSVQRYQPKGYTQDDLQLVEDVAIQVTIAIENARLFTNLQQELEERRSAEARVRQLNEELEQRVRERTLQLETANKELEAFSYSVSHDLRAPLRAINGYSQALVEDYGGQLDETAKDYLERVRAASLHMGSLIDDLLKLSRISRSEMTYRQINLSQIFEEMITELRRTDLSRQVVSVCQPGLMVNGDEHLLRILMSNLCTNAWKFTSKKDAAQIEFGGLESNDQQVFFIRDNGAGFNMAYVDKLFHAFQRLHGVHEFEGTGIGLATVQRIIQRHGGRIWAEGEVEQGAVFYFTLE